ncbi:uncharacterized protein LOC142234185 [Haematobia irritans]|uniref:uncharacterized protein LOC142234185 n=1 Tax=Haematobia irritans TaxID=7368 RepID=UPI003F4FF21A
MTPLDEHFILQEDKWTQLPLHTILYRWAHKNISFSSDITRIIAFIGLFLVLWYTIIWTTRIIIRIIWPLFLIITAVIVFHVLQHYEPDEITDILKWSCAAVADTIIMIIAKFLEIIGNLFE